MRILSLVLLSGVLLLLWLQDKTMQSMADATGLIEETAAVFKKRGYRLEPNAEPVRMDFTPAQSVIIVQETADPGMTRAFRLDRVRSVQIVTDDQSRLQ